MELVNRIASAAVIGAAMLIGSSLSAPPAQAAYIVDLTQEGSNVVATGSGTLDVSDLTFVINESGAYGAVIQPSGGVIVIGPVSASVDDYTGVTGPANFGSGSVNFPNSGSGDLVGIFGSDRRLDVPAGYVSGNALSDTSTCDNASFSSLGVTPGTYKWTWGSGADADSFTLKIGAAAIPEPSTWAMMLLGFTAVGVAGYRRARSRGFAARAAA